ncbi:glycosyltransferase family 39 protein [Pelagibacterales bacterium SAG-MED31]|nr:glycosyltransferase family 39 protein [Pelagibacterales bacterium SAG-MED31]
MNKILICSIFMLIGLKVCAALFTNLSLYGDEAQYWIWSQNLDLGYFSKPPLLAWFLSFHVGIFGDSFFSLKIFPLLIYFFIFFAFYKLCLQLHISKNYSVLCSISFLLIPAASVSSFLISTDLLLLLFWILAITHLLKIRDGGAIIDFFLLGIFLGLGILAKYAAVYFLLCLLILLFSDKKILMTLKNHTAKWLLFVLVVLLVVLPNIYWNIINGWVTLSHTSDNANLQNININFYEPIKFLVAQIFMIGPILFFSFFYTSRSFCLDFENKFLLIFSLPIIIIVLIESFLVRSNANWAAPALISLFVLFFRLVVEKKHSLVIINFATNYIVAFFLFISILISANYKIFDRITGIDDFTKEILKTVGDKDIVVSDRIIFSSISFELKDRTNKVYMPYKAGETITNHFQMSSPLSQLQQTDFYLIGNQNDISYVLKENEVNLIKEFSVSFSSNKLKFYEVNFK